MKRYTPSPEGKSELLGLGAGTASGRGGMEGEKREREREIRERFISVCRRLTH
jgi:hypothetical protein